MTVNDEVVAMLVVHVDDINIATTKEMKDLVVADLNKRLPTKRLGEVTWYMGSEYKGGCEKGTLEIWHSVHPNCCRTFQYHKNQPHSRFFVVRPQAGE